jgi:transmembrane sensor
MAEETHNRNNEFIHDLIAKQLQGELSEQEEKAFLEWLSGNDKNKFFYQESVKAWGYSSRKQEDFNVDTDAAWAKVKLRTEESVKVVRLWERPAFQIAASLVLLLTFGYLTGSLFKASPDYITVATKNERTKFYLPDSSMIWLNKNSSIKYSSDYNKTTREVDLDGEAFFDVRRNEAKKFIVQSHHSMTEVLGTSFIVKSYKNSSKESVEVVTGKVSFSARFDKNKQVLLTPGLRGKLENGNLISMQKITDPNFKAWKENKFEFDNTELGQVIQSLNSYFDIQVSVTNPEILKCGFTGSFDNPDIDQILNIISVSLNIEYKKEYGKYILSGQGCINKNH